MDSIINDLYILFKELSLEKESLDFFPLKCKNCSHNSKVIFSEYFFINSEFSLIFIVDK